MRFREADRILRADGWDVLLNLYSSRRGCNNPIPLILYQSHEKEQ